MKLLQKSERSLVTPVMKFPVNPSRTVITWWRPMMFTPELSPFWLPWGVSVFWSSILGLQRNHTGICGDFIYRCNPKHNNSIAYVSAVRSEGRHQSQQDGSFRRPQSTQAPPRGEILGGESHWYNQYNSFGLNHSKVTSDILYFLILDKYVCSKMP